MNSESRNQLASIGSAVGISGSLSPREVNADERAIQPRILRVAEEIDRIEVPVVRRDVGLCEGTTRLPFVNGRRAHAATGLTSPEQRAEVLLRLAPDLDLPHPQVGLRLRRTGGLPGLRAERLRCCSLRVSKAKPDEPHGCATRARGTDVQTALSEQATEATIAL